MVFKASIIEQSNFRKDGINGAFMLIIAKMFHVNDTSLKHTYKIHFNFCVNFKYILIKLKELYLNWETFLCLI